MATDQNLVLNILTFDHPVKKKTFSFSTEKREGFYPIRKKECWFAYKKLFEEEDTDKSIEYLYTDFSEDNTENSISIDLTKSTRFAKHYYSFLIYRYFSQIKCITNVNFVKDTELWFWNSKSDTSDYHIFKSFVIKIQVNRITDSPELVISYEGISKVLKKNLIDLNVPTEAINKVIYKQRLIRYSKLSDEAKLDLANVHPVLSNSLRAALEIPVEYNKNPNKLKFFYDEITMFVKTYLNNPAFKSIIPLNSDNFIKVPKKRIFNTSWNSNQLIFGNNKTDLNPFMGMVKNGPFKPTPLNNIEFILLFHKDDMSTAKKLISWFDGKVNPRVKSIKDFLKMNYYLDINRSIIFHDLINPMPEIIQQLERWPRNSATRYLGIYISPYPKETTDKAIHSLYYKIKYELLKYRISSQTIEKETILTDSFNFSMPNIAIAILAKLEGIPWRLERTLYNELIIGIGAFKSRTIANRYIGSAFCFANDGHFQSFDCYSAHSTKILAGSIRHAVENFRVKYKQVERLVIHFYKRMSRADLDPILKVLYNLELDIPVIVVSINKTESHDLVIFDQACPSNNMIPDSGTIIDIGCNQYLLCNNTRYGNNLPSSRDGYPFPVKLTIQSTDDTLFEDVKNIKDLIDQVYQFSRMYWKSVTQQNLPVTVKYPAMVAEIYPHFESTSIPDFGKENLWFL